jgi:hypothetical protein
VRRVHHDTATDTPTKAFTGVGVSNRRHQAVEPATLEEIGAERVEEPSAGAEDQVHGGARHACHSRHAVDADRLGRRLAQALVDGIEDAAPGLLRRLGADSLFVPPSRHRN